MSKTSKLSGGQFFRRRSSGEVVKFPHRDALWIKGHIIQPSSLSLAKRYVNRAQDKGLIVHPKEYTIVLSALISAGMTQADENKVNVVSPRHIAQGWRERLSLVGGNCPPHKCSKSSVLQRVDYLKESLPYMVDFMRIIEDNE